MKSEESNLKRMDNVGIAAESLDETIAFFAELGLKLDRLCYIRGPEGIIVALSEQLG